MQKIFVLSLLFALAQTGNSQVIEVTKKDSLLKDVNGNMKADPGDSLRYTTKIIVSGAPASTVMLDTMNFDSNLTINPNYHISPLARKDSFACTGNVGIDVPEGNGLLSNDVDIDDNATGGLKIVMAGSLTPNTAPGVEFTTSKGKVTLDADGLGAFTYDPDAGYNGLDSFVYQLTDGDPVTPDQKAKVIITVSEVMWFVDNTGGGTGGTGTLSDPFKTINDFNISSGPGNNDNIYLARTGTNYTTGIILKSGQTLIGEGTTGTDLATEFGVTLPSHSAMLPPISNASSPIIQPTTLLDEGITLAMNTTIKGVDVKMGVDAGIFGTGALGTITVSEVFLENNAIEEIRLTNATGTMNIDLSGVICISENAIVISGGSINVTFTKTTLTHSGASAMDIGSHSGTITFEDDGVNSIMQTSSGMGLNITTCTGAYNIDNLTVSTGSTGIGIIISNSPLASFTFGNLNITAQTGIWVTGSGGAGTIIVDGSSSINSTTGPALDLTKASSASNNMTFTSVSSTSSSSNGIKLNELGGTLTMNGGSISGATGTAYNVGGASNGSGGNATVTYAGSITNSSGRAILIEELSGGSHTLSGNINHSGSNIGIQVSEIDNGIAASVTFSGTTKSINSGTVNAVDLHTNTNGTINFTEGGLDIDASTGIGVNATGGGTVNVTGSANSITKTGNGNALNIASTNAGGSGITFASINVTGGTGTAVNITSSNGTKNLGDVDVARSGGGAGIVADGAGTLQTTAGTINSGNNTALDINNTVLGMILTSITSSTAANAGIDISTTSGTLTVNGGTITRTQSGSNVVSFTGTNTGTYNLTGVTLNGNGSNGVTLGSGQNGTFSFGDLNVNSPNGGTGVNVNNNSGAITFKSIDQTGGTTGISLTTNTGSFTITGDGTTTRNGTGGTLLNTTGSAIMMSSTTNVDINHLNITNAGIHAADGTGVVNFTLRHGTISGVGPAAVDDHNALNFITGSQSLTGTVVIDNMAFTNYEDTGVDITNSTGTVNVTVSNSLFSDNHATFGNEAIAIESTGTAHFNLNMTDNVITNIGGDALGARVGGGGGVHDFNITGNNSTNSLNNGGGDFVIQMTNSADITFDIQGNTVDHASMTLSGDPIQIVGNGDATGRIGGPLVADGNTLSGQGGDGIRLDMGGSTATSAGNITWNVLIQNNTIGVFGNSAASNTPMTSDEGIDVLSRDHGGTLNLTIEANNIHNSLSRDINLFSDDDSPSNDGPTNNVRIVGNTFTGTVIDDIRVRSTDDKVIDIMTCLHIAGNTGTNGIILLDEDTTPLGSMIQITQADISALNMANTGLTTTVHDGAISGGGTCEIPTLPNNP